jgi:hypothetical protein
MTITRRKLPPAAPPKSRPPYTREKVDKGDFAEATVARSSDAPAAEAAADGAA